MKKIPLLIAVFCIFVLSVQAQPPQLQKGNLYVGASSTVVIGGSEDSNLMGIGFVKTNYKHSGTTTDTYNSFVFNILPKGGYFVMENLVAGLQVILTGYSETETGTDYKYHQRTFGVGPWVRYYYPLGKFYPFAEGGLLIGSYKDSYYTDSDAKEAMFMFGFSAGAAFPVSDNVTFDATIGYSRTSYQPKGDVESEEYNSVCSGFGFGLGISVYLFCLK